VGSWQGMLKSLPNWLWGVFWLLVAILLLILVAWIIHLVGGGLLNLHVGHFVFRIGVT
jgi:hypothetical protein